jgi:hypothetical protein
MTKKEIQVRFGRACIGTGLPIVLLILLKFILGIGDTIPIGSIGVGQMAVAVGLIGGGVGLSLPYEVDTDKKKQNSDHKPRYAGNTTPHTRD